MTTRLFLAGLAIPALLLSPSCKKEESNQAGKDPKKESASSPGDGGTTQGSGPSAVPSGTGGATKILRFSAIPDENTTEQSAKFQKFADYLNEALGLSLIHI